MMYLNNDCRKDCEELKEAAQQWANENKDQAHLDSIAQEARK